MNYSILTNEQLDLGSAFERFQMANYGNILKSEPSIPFSSKPDTRLPDHQELYLLDYPNEQYNHSL